MVLGGSVRGILVYGKLLAFFPLDVLQMTAMAAFVILPGVLGWMARTKATTPAAEPSVRTTQGRLGARHVESASDTTAAGDFLRRV